MDFIINTLALFGIFAMVTISTNHLVGTSGVLFLGQVAFFAVGAYAVAVLPHLFNWPVALAAVAGMIVAITLAGLTALVFKGLSGHFLLISSLGICEIVRSVANNAIWTGGAQGIVVDHQLLNMPIPYQIPLLTLFLVILQLSFYRKLAGLPKGRLFASVRENGLLLAAHGYSVNQVKLEAMLWCAAWVSLAGTLFALQSLYIDPGSFTVEQSLLIFIALLIGGLGNLKGSLFAAFVLVIVPVVIRFIPIPSAVISAVHQLIFAACVLLIIKYLPHGITGKSA